MTSYILFFSGVFSDMDEIEDSIGQAFEDVDLKSVKFVFESNRNGFIVFETDKSVKDINKIIFDVLSFESITSYFIFKRDIILSTYISTVVKDFLYEPIVDDQNVLKYNKTEIKKIEFKENEQSYELDRLLEKVDSLGVDSLTEEEKKYLDNYNE